MKLNREVQSEEGHTGLNRVPVYVFAVAVVLATLLFRLIIGETFLERPLMILFVLPILLSAYLGGLGPGLVATVAAILAISYRLIPPTYSLAIDKSADFIQLTMLVLVGVLISVLSEFLHRFRRRIETSRLLQAVTLASIGDAVITTDNRGRITFLNFEAERLTGWTYEEALGRPLPTVFRIINEQNREQMEDPVAKVLASRHVIGLANHTLLLARDGREISIDDSAAPIKAPDGAILGVVLVFHDCTAKRQAEAALRQSEEHYRSLFDNMLNGFAYCQMHFENQQPVDFTYLLVNQAFETLTGLHEVVGKKVSEVIPGIRETDPRLFEIYGRVAATGAPEQFETYLEALKMWFSVSVYGPEPGFFVAIFDVITERKRVEEALRVSLKVLEAIQRHTEILPLLEEVVAIIKDYTGCEAVGIRVLDEAGNIPYQAYQGFSSRFYEMESPLSIHSNQCMCSNVIKGDTNPRLPFYTNGGSFFMNGTSRFLAEVSAEDKGSTRNVCNQEGYESVALIPFRQGRQILGLIHVADSRENKLPLSTVQLLENAGMQLGMAFLRLQAEAALRQSEDNLRLFIEYAPVSLAMLDRQMRYLSVSRRWLTDYNLDGRDILGLSHYEVFPEISEYEKEIHRRGLAGEVVRSEGDRFERLDGSVQYLRWEVRPWYDASGGMAGIVIFTEDITARQEAEDALRRSLAEKTALLKEVHHRVKNNLQIVVSLLSLQVKRAPHPEVVRVLEDTRRRVHSMALLHEALYRSDSLARINFASYVEDLCRHLRRSNGATTGRVEVENQIAPFGLPLEQSIPCGLIINELVSNALKHAFPDNRAGKVTVSLGPADADHLLLRVVDNGVGPPPVFDLVTTPTLGLRLVSGLASQLAGQLTVEQPDGVGLAFQVVFPIPADTVIEGQA
jgi:PAS domain S-box-containing protein